MVPRSEKKKKEAKRSKKKQAEAKRNKQNQKEEKKAKGSKEKQKRSTKKPEIILRYGYKDCFEMNVPLQTTFVRPFWPFFCHMYVHLSQN